MKKLILLLTLIVTVTISKADIAIVDDSSAVKTVTTSEAERLVDKYSEKVFNTFSELIESTTPLVKEGFGYVVKYQIAKGIVYLLPLVLFIVFLILFLKYHKKCLEDDTKYMEDSAHFPLFVVFAVLGIVTLILTACCTYDGVIHLIAPEWMAIKEIIQTVK